MELIIWLVVLVTIIYLVCVNYLLKKHNHLLLIANTILQKSNDDVLRNMIKFNEEMRIVKIEFDNLCREINNDAR